MAQNINLPSQVFQGILQLSNEEVGIFMKGISKYIYEGIEPEFDNGLKYMFLGYKPFFDEDRNRYLKFIYKQRKNGSEGGRPKKDFDNREISSKPKKPKKPTDMTGIDIYTNINNIYNIDIKVIDILKEYNKQRKRKLESLTERGLELFIKELQKFGVNNEGMIKVLERSIMKGWEGIFELPGQIQPTTQEDYEKEFGKLGHKLFKEKYGEEIYMKTYYSWRDKEVNKSMKSFTN